MEKISRRDFLKKAAVGGMMMPLMSRNLLKLFKQQTIIVIIKDQYSTSGSSINQGVVQIMIDEGIKELTGISDVGEAWKSVFPNINQSDIISLKVNCINGSVNGVVSSPEVAETIIEGLAQMSVGGSNYIRNNAIVWDRTDYELSNNGAYTIYDGSEPNQYRCFGTDHDGVGYDYSNPLDVNGVTEYPSNIISQYNRFLIDLSCLKTHGTSLATLNLKNHYGSVHSPGSLHGNQCNPYIPALNAEIRDQLNDPQKIFIIDGLFGRCGNWGPGGSADANEQLIVMSLDPVACDYVGQERINDWRSDNGYSPIDAPHIHTAADPPYNLGTDDPAEMDIRWIIDPSNKVSEEVSNGVAILSINPNPFRDHADIEFGLKTSTYVQVNIYNNIGQQISNICDRQLNPGTHRFRIKGDDLSSGIYHLHIRTPKTTLRRKLVVTK